MFRYNLLCKLAQIHKGDPKIQFIIHNDNHLTNQQKQSILKKYLPKTGSVCAESTETEVLQAANLHISQGRVIEGLTVLFKKKEWTDNIYNRVYELVTLPQILTNYKKTVNNSLTDLLSQRPDSFADLLLILSIARRERLSLQQSIRLVQVLAGKSKFQRFFHPQVKSFLQNALEKIIIESIMRHNPFLEYITTHVNLKLCRKQFIR